jgi:hypothetical protein
MTLPPEMGITMTPRMMTVLQLCASFGEMLCPFLMGLAFQLKRYTWFYGLILTWQSFVLGMLVVPWMLLTRKLALPQAMLTALTTCQRRLGLAATL